MVKTLLIVSMLVSSGNYQIEYPNMDECLSAKQEIISQDKDVQAICVRQTAICIPKHNTICLPKEKSSWELQREKQIVDVEARRNRRVLCRQVTTVVSQLKGLFKEGFKIPNLYGLCF